MLRSLLVRAPAVPARARSARRAASALAVRSMSSAVDEPSAAARLPRDVCTFWFGDEWESAPAKLSTPAYFGDKMKLWFGGDAEGDAKCAAFAPLIHAAGKGELAHWAGLRGARIATVVLLDQLTRGAFRGTPAAFAYDAVALQAAKDALAAGEDKHLSVAERLFLYLPIEHDETAESQAEAVKRFNELAADAPDVPMVQYAVKIAREHADVVARFGHFPHRNRARGRATTPEEAAWLASPECYSWAKSQG